MTPGELDERVVVERSERGVLTAEEAAVLVQMAGYRNRLVHFDHSISDEELHSICARRLGDIESALGGVHRWVREQRTVEGGPK